MKKWYLLPIIAAIVIVGCILFFKSTRFKIQDPPPKPPRQQMANEEEGRFLLRNIAIAQQAYSATRGGGGQKFFTDKIEELQPYASQKTIATIKTINHPGQQWGGYYLIIREKNTRRCFSKQLRRDRLSG